MASLHREIAGIGYEGFRKMIDGKIMPRKDIMEQVAAVLDIEPREFPEYRLLQIHDACRRFPEIDKIFYEQIMATAARLEEKKDALWADENSPLEGQGRNESGGAAH